MKKVHLSLCKTRLFETVLREVDLRGADLEGADLLRADLTGATWEGTRFGLLVKRSRLFRSFKIESPPSTATGGTALGRSTIASLIRINSLAYSPGGAHLH